MKIWREKHLWNTIFWGDENHDYHLYVGTKGARALTTSHAMGYWLEEWHFQCLYFFLAGHVFEHETWKAFWKIYPLNPWIRLGVGWVFMVGIGLVPAIPAKNIPLPLDTMLKHDRSNTKLFFFPGGIQDILNPSNLLNLLNLEGGQGFRSFPDFLFWTKVPPSKESRLLHLGPADVWMFFFGWFVPWWLEDDLKLLIEDVI